jgi:Cu(I)/Ag(I) efflux system membrane fusion protein
MKSVIFGGCVAIAALLGGCGTAAPPLVPAATAAPAPVGGPGTEAAGAHSGHEGHAGHPAAAGPPPGYAPVDVSAAPAGMLGIRTAPVSRARLLKKIRTVGLVTTDETRVSHVHVKFDGFIEDVYAGFVGGAVAKGDRLFTIFSPDVLAAEQDYLSSRNALERASTGPLAASSRSAAESMVAASRRRLELLDVPAAAIAAIERTGVAPRTIRISAPRTGTILERNALPGKAVGPMDHLYVIADLTHVWVLADVYESDLPLVAPGAHATLTIAALPGKVFAADVTFISPDVNDVTRTAKVRLELDNPAASLKPGMFATVSLEADLGEGLIVPSDAVIDTGERKIVFVATGPGHFEPRAITVGAPLGDDYQVLAGLAAGELIATSGQFLLDSESRLRGAAAGGAGPPSHAGH